MQGEVNKIYRLKSCSSVCCYAQVNAFPFSTYIQAVMNIWYTAAQEFLIAFEVNLTVVVSVFVFNIARSCSSLCYQFAFIVVIVISFGLRLENALVNKSIELTDFTTYFCTAIAIGTGFVRSVQPCYLV